MTITKRNEQGKVIPGGSEISSETARALAEKRWKSEREKPEVVAAILTEAGYGPENPPPALVEELARKIPGSSQVGVSAAKEFIRLAYGGQGNEGAGLTVNPGEKCPTCGQVQGAGLIDAELADQLLALLYPRGEKGA